MKLSEVEGLALTYPEVGATGREPLPAGYHHVRLDAEIGTGPAAFARVADHLLSWRMHRAAGAGVTATADAAAVGVVVVSTLGVGPLAIAAPCRVVWAVREPAVAGFAYGTLPGHPARGEERFELRLADDGRVALRVRAFSAPARWFMRAGGPVPRLLQRQFARRCAAALVDVAQEPAAQDPAAAGRESEVGGEGD